MDNHGRVRGALHGARRPREGRGPRRPPDPTASVDLERGGEKKDRLFDPYTGADLGDNFTRGKSAVLWLVRLHDELLLERLDGTWWNGVLSLVFTLVVLTGFVVWWPGVTRWTRSLRISTKSGWRRFNWDLHSALGFWLLLFMLMWGVSGWYLGMPEPLTLSSNATRIRTATTVRDRATLRWRGWRDCISDAGAIRRGDHG